MQSPKERKYPADIQSSRLNADDGENFVAINEFVNLSNFRSGSTDKGITGTLESIGSNTLLSTPLPSQTFITIGGAIETERNRFCFFRVCTTGPWHKISCRDNTPGIETEFDILFSSQVTGGLNFDKNSIIHSARIVNGVLYWVDGTTNQPNQVDIDAAIKGNYPTYVTDSIPYSYPINFSEITLIKPPPPLAPNIQKATDGAFENNFIANDSFMFCFRYKFYGSNISVLGTYSPSSRLNKINATENYVAATMDPLEVIPQRVRIVELIMRFSNSNNAVVVKNWDKEVSSESTEIDNQNNGVQVLTFNFYNTITGETIPNGLDEQGNQIPGVVNQVLKPFDIVPIFSQSLEAAKDKLFLFNNTQGYDTPQSTSLSSSFIETVTYNVNLRKPLIKVKIVFQFGAIQYRSYVSWYVFLTEVVPTGYYEITSTAQFQSSAGIPIIPSLGAAPGFVSFGSLTFRGSSQSEVISYVRTASGTPSNNFLILNSFVTQTDPIAGFTNITGLSTTTYDFFKTRTQYQIGVVFYDFAMRKCGVVTNSGLIFETPTRDFNFSQGVNGVVWSLTNDNALSEIPDWAYYYSIVRTLNLKTRFFIQSFTNAAKYATKSSSTPPAYQFTSNTFITSAIGIGLNTQALIQSGLGYEFTEGDVCVLIEDDNTVAELPVIGQDGQYIIVAAKNLGDLSNRRFIFEIYTPYQKSIQEPFFEIGEMYRIVNPGTSARQYETLSDILLPDIYVVTRNYGGVDYFAEAMSPNDKFWQRWDNDGGKVDFVTKLGQVVKTNSISFSNNFIPNTDINGLNTFDALDEANLPLEGGPIRKGQLTSKVQEELGSVMLVLCEKQTISLYVGEVQQYGSTGRAANIVTSEQVIGTINILKGNYGTVDPASVAEFRGKVWFFDAINGKWIQYADNGLFPISNYKMTRFWGQWAKQYLLMTKEQIELFGDRPFVFATVDPYHGELLISIPRLSDVPPKGYLPDYELVSQAYNVYSVRQSYSIGGNVSYYYALYVFISGIDQSGYYLVPNTEMYTTIPVPDILSPLGSYEYNDVIFRGSTIDLVYENTLPDGTERISDSITLTTPSTTIVNNVKVQKINPFDILDFRGKTMVFQLDKGAGSPKWMGSYPFTTDFFITLLNNLYSFKNGLLYIHNQTTSYGSYYGESNKSAVMLVFNKDAPLEKILHNISIKANITPALVYAYCDNPYQQVTELKDFNLKNLAAIIYSTFFKNKLMPTATGYSTNNILTGSKVRAASIFMLIEFTVNIIPAELEYISVGYETSIGQTF